MCANTVIYYICEIGNVCCYFLGVLEAEFQENEVNVIPITYPFATSHIWWPINHAEEFNIKFDFRSSRTAAVLAYSDVTTVSGNGFWEVSVSVSTHIYLCVRVHKPAEKTLQRNMISKSV